MFNFLKRDGEAKDNTVTKIDLFNVAMEWLGFGQSTKAGRIITPKLAIEVAAVFCAVRVIAEGMAQMPLRIKRETVKDDRVYAPIERDHWAVTLMTKRPNSWMTPYEFIEYSNFIAALTGDFIAVKHRVKADRREIKELLPVPPGNWRVEQDSKYNLLYWVTGADGKELPFLSKDIYHLRGPTMNAYSGLAPVNIAREAIGLASVLEEQQAKLAANGARPSGILSKDGKLNKDQAEQIKKSWTERFGANGEGGIALLDGGFKFEQTQMTSVDMQHLETRKHQIEEIARYFRVFPQMLMQSDKTSTFASAEQFFTAHVIYTLGPWIERNEGVINRDILGGDDALYADFDERNLLRGSFKDQAEYYAKALGSGGTPAWMTQNEVRETMGLEPSDEESADLLFDGFNNGNNLTGDQASDQGDDENV